MLQWKGTSFRGVKNLKAWTDEIDKCPIYKINAEEYVFKTPKSKLNLVIKMNSVDHYLSEGFFLYMAKQIGSSFFTLYQHVFITHF